MLGIVLVSYKTEDKTIGYVQQELSKIQCNHILVIVNNSCTEESNTKLAKGCKAEIVTDADKINDASDTFVLGAKDNLGYAKGNNLGADFLTRHFDIDYFLFTNNDLKLVDEDVVEKLIEKAREHQEIGAIGPRVLGPDSKDQSPGRYLTIWQCYIGKYGLYPITRFFYKTGYFDEIVDANSDGFCYRLSGSFILVKAHAFLQSNGFDSETFLYGEELILAERLLAKGYKQYYLAVVSVIHEHNQTIGLFFCETQKRWLMFASDSYYYRKYKKHGNLLIETAKISLALYLYCYSPVTGALKAFFSRKKA